VIFHDVHIAKGAVVRDCVVMQSSTIQEGVEISAIIADKNVTIRPGTKLNGTPNCPFVVPKNSQV
jgi:glucose-1-phosphate adenylyltransferase